MADYLFENIFEKQTQDIKEMVSMIWFDNFYRFATVRIFLDYAIGYALDKDSRTLRIVIEEMSAAQEIRKVFDNLARDGLINTIKVFLSHGTKKKMSLDLLWIEKFYFNSNYVREIFLFSAVSRQPIEKFENILLAFDTLGKDFCKKMCFEKA